MEKEKKNIIFAIILTVLVMLLIFAGFLGILSTKGYLNLHKNESHINENNDDSNDKNIDTGNGNETDKNTVDYKEFIGNYTDDSNKTTSDVHTNGGVILKISDISDKNISFIIQHVSATQRIASAEHQEIEITSIENQTYSFKWKDSWLNEGTGSITIKDDELLLTVTTTKISEDNNTGWNLGNYSNEKMYKVNQ